MRYELWADGCFHSDVTASVEMKMIPMLEKAVSRRWKRGTDVFIYRVSADDMEPVFVYNSETLRFERMEEA